MAKKETPPPVSESDTMMAVHLLKEIKLLLQKILKAQLAQK